MLNYKTSDWETFFGEDTKPKVSSRGTYSGSQTEVLVSDSAFIYCTSDSTGGAISYSKSGTILIEFSTFTECFTVQNEGGAIYVNATCHCVLDCVCSFKCYSKTSTGQFIYTKLQSEDYLNFVHRSSICSTDGVPGNGKTIYGAYGKQECKSVNISNNYVNYDSALCYDYGSPNPTNIQFCEINSNYAENCKCLYLHYDGISYSIDKCNIIYNKQNTNSDGTIYSHTKPTTITNSYLIGNTGGQLFSGTGTITISNCVIPDNFVKPNNVIIDSTTNVLSLTFEDFVDDCSHIIRIKCNTNDCQHFPRIISLFHNLFVFHASITIQ